MRFAYADPPYYGQCAKYNHYHPDGLCWDEQETHRLLVKRLTDEFPDGWALSLSSPSLRTILPHCPLDVRVAVWCKSFCAFKKGVRPAYAWEPVIFRGGRNPLNGHKHPPPVKGGKQTTPKDFIVEPITLQKGLTGAKPERFCRWVLQLLNAQENDDVIDLFPGTGVMGRVALSLDDEHLSPLPEPINNDRERKATLNYRLILRTYAQLRQLTDDETALLNTLRGMSESERELLAETLGPAVKVKGKPPATKRVIEKCATEIDGDECGLTRRARIHKDKDSSLYHEFTPSQSSSKSKRAESLAGAIKKKSGDKEPRCVACYEIRDHANHDLDNGGHEFTTDLAGRVNEVLDKHDEDDASKADDRCSNCIYVFGHNVHHLPSTEGYHEFQSVSDETAVGVGG